MTLGVVGLWQVNATLEKSENGATPVNCAWRTDVPAGVQHLTADAWQQYGLGESGGRQQWRCRSQLEFDTVAGSVYSIAFNFDKDHPRFDIRDKQRNTIVASADCARVSVYAREQT